MKSPESTSPAKNAPAPNNLFAAINARARGPSRVCVTAFIMPCGMAAIERVYSSHELTGPGRPLPASRQRAWDSPGPDPEQPSVTDRFRAGTIG